MNEIFYDFFHWKRCDEFIFYLISWRLSENPKRHISTQTRETHDVRQKDCEKEVWRCPDDSFAWKSARACDVRKHSVAQCAWFFHAFRVSRLTRRLFILFSFPRFMNEKLVESFELSMRHFRISEQKEGRYVLQRQLFSRVNKRNEHQKQ